VSAAEEGDDAASQASAAEQGLVDAGPWRNSQEMEEWGRREAAGLEKVLRHLAIGPNQSFYPPGGLAGPQLVEAWATWGREIGYRCCEGKWLALINRLARKKLKEREIPSSCRSGVGVLVRISGFGEQNRARAGGRPDGDPTMKQLIEKLDGLTGVQIARQTIRVVGPPYDMNDEGGLAVTTLSAITVIDGNLAHAWFNANLHKCLGTWASQYRRNDNSLLIPAGRETVRLRLELQYTEEHKQANTYVMRVIGLGGRAPWKNNQALTVFLSILHSLGSSEYEAGELIRYQLMTQGVDASTVYLKPRFPCATISGAPKQVEGRWEAVTEEIEVTLREGRKEEPPPKLRLYLGTVPPSGKVKRGEKDSVPGLVLDVRLEKARQRQAGGQPRAGPAAAEGTDTIPVVVFTHRENVTCAWLLGKDGTSAYNTCPQQAADALNAALLGSIEAILKSDTPVVPGQSNQQVYDAMRAALFVAEKGFIGYMTNCTPGGYLKGSQFYLACNSLEAARLLQEVFEEGQQLLLGSAGKSTRSKLSLSLWADGAPELWAEVNLGVGEVMVSRATGVMVQVEEKCRELRRHVLLQGAVMDPLNPCNLEDREMQALGYSLVALKEKYAEPQQRECGICCEQSSGAILGVDGVFLCHGCWGLLQTITCALRFPAASSHRPIRWLSPGTCAQPDCQNTSGAVIHFPAPMAPTCGICGLQAAESQKMAPQFWTARLGYNTAAAALDDPILPQLITAALTVLAARFKSVAKQTSMYSWQVTAMPPGCSQCSAGVALDRGKSRDLCINCCLTDELCRHCQSALGEGQSRVTGCAKCSAAKQAEGRCNYCDSEKVPGTDLCGGCRECSRLYGCPGFRVLAAGKCDRCCTVNAAYWDEDGAVSFEECDVQDIVCVKCGRPGATRLDLPTRQARCAECESANGMAREHPRVLTFTPSTDGCDGGEDMMMELDEDIESNSWAAPGAAVTFASASMMAGSTTGKVGTHTRFTSSSDSDEDTSNEVAASKSSTAPGAPVAKTHTSEKATDHDVAPTSPADQKAEPETWGLETEQDALVQRRRKKKEQKKVVFRAEEMVEGAGTDLSMAAGAQADF
jgi:hypothetical protein